jgi:hypothetical protein
VIRDANSRKPLEVEVFVGIECRWMGELLTRLQASQSVVAEPMGFLPR